MLTELISAGSSSESVTDQVEHIRDAARRLTSMVDHLISDAMADALRHHHSPRAGRCRGPGRRSRRCQPAVGREQAADHHRCRRRAGFRHDVRCRTGCGRRSTISSATPSNTVRSAARSRWWSRHEQNNTIIRISRRGRRPVSRGSRPIVRPLPAAIRKTHRRRKLDRPRAFDRQAHHRHAWRPGDRRIARVPDRARLSPSYCPATEMS